MEKSNAPVCQEYCPHQEKIEAVEELSEEEIGKLAETFKVLGDPTRIKIINALVNEELCVCDLSEIINMSQSATSHQLRALRRLNLVKCRREGRMVYYSLSDNHIMQLFCQGLDHIKEK